VYGRVRRYSFRTLGGASGRLANALTGLGVRRGDIVAVLLPQCPETVISHLAIYRLGAIALPLSTTSGVDALEYRLADSGARAIVTTDQMLDHLLEMRDRLCDGCLILSIDAKRHCGVFGFDDLLRAADPAHRVVDVRAEEAAMILYTSGTSGPPKGVLHAHRVLLGSMPGVEFCHESFPQTSDLMWTPADWAWTGGLLDMLLPCLYHGVPVVACNRPAFDPEFAFGLIGRHRIRNAFLPPTALKLMREVKGVTTDMWSHRMRTIATGGERLGGEGMLIWGRETFGLTINEFYGQTEVHAVIGNCAKVMAPKPGSIGRAIPGHDICIVDDDGYSVPAGHTGIIAVRTPDPVAFLGYWQCPERTSDKFKGECCLTGDFGHIDTDGYVWFHGRQDDLIVSAGYRIGPAEIEECLLRHEAVRMVAVVGVPDELRGSVVKAFVILRSGYTPGDAVASDIQKFAVSRLSAHECPRQIEFRESLPMTTTGKISRRELAQASQADWERGRHG
jgi:acetyl-CoA synthetase